MRVTNSQQKYRTCKYSKDTVKVFCLNLKKALNFYEKFLPSFNKLECLTMFILNAPHTAQCFTDYYSRKGEPTLNVEILKGATHRSSVLASKRLYFSLDVSWSLPIDSNC